MPEQHRTFARMQAGIIDYHSSTVHFLYAGTGDEIVLCFHGYGENARSFTFLPTYLPADRYTVIAIDMPFHGNTDWKHGFEFKPADLQQIVSDVIGFCRPGISITTISLIGFSLGGRVALALYQLNPEQVKKIVLIAPDGLKVNSWYWLATQTWLGNRLFAFTMKYPSWFFFLLKGLNKLNLVNASIYKFVRHYIGDKNVRQQLYARWTTLRRLRPDLPFIKSLILRHQLPVRMLYGKHDRIILSSVGEKFRKNIELCCEIKILASGHQVLQEKYAEEIVAALQQ